jgi:predicted GNAT family acetyltransferase
VTRESKVPAVRDVPDKSRFEMETEGGVAVALYRKDGNIYRVTHTEVPRAVECRGLGSQLVKGMLDVIRSEGSRVTPMCGFVRRYFALHPEDSDLLA